MSTCSCSIACYVAEMSLAQACLIRDETRRSWTPHKSMPYPDVRRHSACELSPGSDSPVGHGRDREVFIKPGVAPSGTGVDSQPCSPCSPASKLPRREQRDVVEVIHRVAVDECRPPTSKASSSTLDKARVDDLFDWLQGYVVCTELWRNVLNASNENAYRNELHSIVTKACRPSNRRCSV